MICSDTAEHGVTPCKTQAHVQSRRLGADAGFELDSIIAPSLSAYSQT